MWYCVQNIENFNIPKNSWTSPQNQPNFHYTPNIFNLVNRFWEHNFPWKLPLIYHSSKNLWKSPKKSTQFPLCWIWQTQCNENSMDVFGGFTSFMMGGKWVRIFTGIWQTQRNGNFACIFWKFSQVFSNVLNFQYS